METIKNYLETMFRNLPKTEKVLRAKSELLQMMEDKYTELVESGVSENEAVGTVISEFGNLDELADDLGISEELVVHKTVNEKSRKVTYEEVISFLNWRKQVPIFRGLGIGLCICCVVFPIILEFLPFGDPIGAVSMFISIAVGVCLIVYSNRGNSEWDFLRRQPCSIDEKTYNYVSEKRRNFIKTYSILTSISIGCYILCFVPSIFLSQLNSDFLDSLGGALLFVFIAAGVFLTVYANTVKASYNFILSLNSSSNNFADASKGDSNKKSPYYHKSWDDESNDKEDLKSIKNPTLRAILSVYWLTATCIYLCWSFITFDWHITWIIWPIAGIVYSLIKAFAKKEDL